jgi:hypothetical protein
MKPTSPLLKSKKNLKSQSLRKSPKLKGEISSANQAEELIELSNHIGIPPNEMNGLVPTDSPGQSFHGDSSPIERKKTLLACTG